MARVLAASVLLGCAALAPARAGELLEMAGVEPLKSLVNDNRETVRILFLGSPT